MANQKGRMNERCFFVVVLKEHLANTHIQVATVELQTGEAANLSEAVEALLQQMKEELGRNEAEVEENIAALETLSKNMLNKFSLRHCFSNHCFLKVT